MSGRIPAYPLKTWFQEASSVPNGNTNVPMAEGNNGPEVADRLNQQVGFQQICIMIVINIVLSSDMHVEPRFKIKIYIQNINILFFLFSPQDNRNVDLKSERYQPSAPTASIYGPPILRSVVPSESM